MRQNDVIYEGRLNMFHVLYHMTLDLSSTCALVGSIKLLEFDIAVIRSWYLSRYFGSYRFEVIVKVPTYIYIPKLLLGTHLVYI